MNGGWKRWKPPLRKTQHAEKYEHEVRIVLLLIRKSLTCQSKERVVRAISAVVFGSVNFDSVAEPWIRWPFR